MYLCNASGFVLTTECRSIAESESVPELKSKLEKFVTAVKSFVVPSQQQCPLFCVLPSPHSFAMPSWTVEESGILRPFAAAGISAIRSGI